MPETSLYGGVTNRRITIRDLQTAKERGERWPMLTAYDYSTSRIFDEAGIPVLLVGDSAANVVYGYDTTVPVSVDELLPLVRGVVRGSSRALVVADLPFGSYQASPQQALETAARFMKEGGAQAVKLEGGQRVAAQVETLVSAGVPVMAHIGLTPQSVNAFGGYRVQGRGDEAAHRLLQDAKALQHAGAFAVVLEVVPSDVAAQVTAGAHHPHHRYRRRRVMRRAGARVAGHGRAARRRQAGEVRQGVRAGRRRPARRGRSVRCRGARRRLSLAGVHLQLSAVGPLEPHLSLVDVGGHEPDPDALADRQSSAGAARAHGGRVEHDCSGMVVGVDDDRVELVTDAVAQQPRLGRVDDGAIHLVREMIGPLHLVREGRAEPSAPSRGRVCRPCRARQISLP